MNLAILSESPADEAAVRILAESALARPVAVVETPVRRPGGISGVLRAIEPVMQWLHYRRRAEALVVVVDSNNSPVHPGPIEAPCSVSNACRLCRIRRAIEDVQRSLSTVAYGPIHTAVGLAAPAIEAWYLCGEDPNVSESAWVRGQQEGRPPYTKEQLKKLVYGKDQYGLAEETECAIAEMGRIARDLGLLERKFPIGFGALLHDLRGWAGSGQVTLD